MGTVERQAGSRLAHGLMALSIVLAVGIRLVLLYSYEPLYGNDAPSYTALAELIRTGDFSDYDGFRTPGYPLFMLLFGMDNDWIRMAQNALGLLSIAMAYVLARRLVSRRMAWGVVLLLSISMHFPFYEAIIQTESVALFTMLGTVACFVATPSKRNAFLAGLFASLGALVRPQFLFLPPLLVLLLVYRHWRQWKRLIGEACALAMPVAALVGGWVLFNYCTLSRATFTTMGNVAIMAHMVPYVADADDQFAPVRDAFVEALEHRQDAVRASGDNRAGYFGYALDRLKERGAYDKSTYSDTLGAMVKDLIQKHPLGYLKHVFLAWLRFWRVNIIVYQECFTRHFGLGEAVAVLWFPIKAAWLIVNGLFLALMFVLPRMKMSGEKQFVAIVLYSIVWMSSITVALTSYYDNARYAVPIQPLCAIGVALALQTAIDNYRLAREAKGSKAVG